MERFADSPFAGQLEVIATLKGRVIEASIDELQKRDELTLALRAALKEGVTVNDLSNASGLTTEEIRKVTSRELAVVNDEVDTLAGLS